MDIRPKSWQEYCKRDNHPESGCFIDVDSFIQDCVTDLELDEDLEQNVMSSREDAESILELMKLRTLWRSWVGPWKPDWTSDEDKFCIEFYESEPSVDAVKNFSRPLAFPTREMAEEFLVCFKDLIEKAKEIL